MVARDHELAEVEELAARDRTVAVLVEHEPEKAHAFIVAHGLDTLLLVVLARAFVTNGGVDGRS